MKLFKKQTLLFFSLLSAFCLPLVVKQNIKSVEEELPAVAPYNPNMHAYPCYSFETEPNYSTQNDWTFEAMSLGSITSKYTGKNVKLAIIDSGINYNHEDFKNAGVNVVDSHSMSIEWENNTWKKYKKSAGQESHLADSNGHGTNVAACVASQINGVGGSGIAPDVDLYIFNAQGYQWGAIQTALNECVTLDVDIVNMSIQAYENSGDGYDGGYDPDSVYGLQDHINSCFNNGITVVAAAGNHNTSEPSYPASYNHVISVGSLAKSSKSSKASYSNTYGIDVVTSGSVYVAGKDSSNHYKETQGTSFSSPLVAAAIALYKEKYPSASPSTIETALKNSCDAISGNPSWAGSGRINVERFLNEDYSLDFTNVEDKLEIDVGSTYQLEWAFTPNTIANKNVHFDNSHDNVLTVSEEGLITAISEGESVIQIYSDQNYHYYDEVTVTVTNSGPTPTVSSVTVSPNALALDLNGVKTGNLTATVNGDNSPAQTVTWSSDNTSVATVSNDGVVTAKAVGSAVITATSTIDTTKSGSCSVTVSYTESQTLTITRSSFGSTGNYAWYSWSQNTSTGVSIGGKAEIYANTNTSMQFNKGNGNKVAAIYNSIAIPGSITKIEATTSSGTNRSWDAYVTSTACSASDSTLTFGNNKTTVGNNVTIGTSSTSLGTSSSGYSYFCLQEYASGASYISQFKITYTPKSLSSIAIKTAPTKTTYESGEYFNPAGLVITATYSDNSTSDISYADASSSFEFTPSTSTALTTSNTSVTITYGGKSCSQSITVTQAVTLSSISISGNYQTSFVEGDHFSFGGIVTANYSDGSHSDVTNNATFTGYDLTNTGNQTVTVRYTFKNVEKTEPYIINVTAGTLSSIAVSGQTTIYQKNAEFLFDGTCTATFENGYQKAVTPTSVSSPDMSSGGNKTVTISYTYNGKTKTTSYEITVNAYRKVMEAQTIEGNISWPTSSTASISGSVAGLKATISGKTNYESSSMRLGTGSGGGTLTVSASIAIVSLKINAKYYSSSYSSSQLNVDGQVVSNLTSSYKDYVVTLSNAKTSFSISTSNDSNRVNIKSVTVYAYGEEIDIGQSDDCVGLETFINKYMHMDYTDNLGYCSDSTHHYYATAKDAFNLLNVHQRKLFTTNSAYLVEWTRLSTWASKNGDSLNSSSILSSIRFINLDSSADNSLFTVILIAGLTTISLFVLIVIKKKKKY